MDFVAIDFETANEDYSSICQIGVCGFSNEQVEVTYSTLVDPDDYFSPINVAIHKLDESIVRGAPLFPEIYGALENLLAGRLVVCHTHFDRLALQRVCEKHGLKQIECEWLDSARVVRRAWEQFHSKGYGLRNVAKFLSIEFQHHDALEDARACGEILLAAIEASGIPLMDWPKRVTRPINPRAAGGGSSGNVKLDGNPDGHLFGEVVVFTGSLSLVRREAAKLAADAGCGVSPNVSKKTTLLVVGDQDIRMLDGKDKSSKHRKAEVLAAKGQEIRIVQESDFLELVSL